MSTSVVGRRCEHRADTFPSPPRSALEELTSIRSPTHLRRVRSSPEEETWNQVRTSRRWRPPAGAGLGRRRPAPRRDGRGEERPRAVAARSLASPNRLQFHFLPPGSLAGASGLRASSASPRSRSVLPKQCGGRSSNPRFSLLGTEALCSDSESWSSRAGGSRARRPPFDTCLRRTGLHKLLSSSTKTHFGENVKSVSCSPRCVSRCPRPLTPDRELRPAVLGALRTRQVFLPSQVLAVARRRHRGGVPRGPPPPQPPRHRVRNVPVLFEMGFASFPLRAGTRETKRWSRAEPGRNGNLATLTMCRAGERKGGECRLKSG